MLSEQSCASGETPDVIGWKGRCRSVLIECKVSRADFLADREKPFRKDPSLGMGCERFYLTPAGLIRPAELPGKWGLLLPLLALVVIAALVLGLRALPLYVIVLTLVSWIGLSWIYVISHFEYSSYLDSTKERVIASIVLAGAALLPLLASEAWARAQTRASWR